MLLQGWLVAPYRPSVQPLQPLALHHLHPTTPTLPGPVPTIVPDSTTSSSYSNKMASLELSPTTTDSPNVTLTIRLIMQGKEVGSIIGKKGDIVKRFREESGAKINISDGSCPERIVTVTGNTESIFKAFTLICNKFEEDLSNLISPGTVPRPPITFRLVVPASQCGSLIGKGGSKIKEIREITGASIQVASEMLPNSTERAVTVSGASEAVIQCIFHICTIMSEMNSQSPPKGVTVPYTPIKALNVGGGVHTLPAFFPANSQAVVPHNPTTVQPQIGKMGLQMSSLNGNPLASNLLNPAALAMLSGQGRSASSQQTHEMTVPNELIGCIIGKGGSKVAEIRQLSGAMIRISNCEDRDAPANLDRTISITGNTESVALAQYLINMSMEVFRANLQLLEEQGLLPAETQSSKVPKSTTTNPSSPSNNSSSSNTSLQQRPSPPKSIADHVHTNVHSPNNTQPTQLDLNTTNPFFTQINNNNNNNNVAALKAYQMPMFHAGFTAEQAHGGLHPMLGAQLLGGHQGQGGHLAAAPGGHLAQAQAGQQQLAAAGLLFPQHQALGPVAALQLAATAQHQQPPSQPPLLLTNKLKAQSSLISIPSPRDHKFMPY